MTLSDRNIDFLMINDASCCFLGCSISQTCWTVEKIINRVVHLLSVRKK